LNLVIASKERRGKSVLDKIVEEKENILKRKKASFLQKLLNG
jgi:hypothetical protein